MNEKNSLFNLGIQPYELISPYEKHCELLSHYFSDDEIKIIDETDAEIPVLLNDYDTFFYWIGRGKIIKTITGFTCEDFSNFYEDYCCQIVEAFAPNDDFQKLHRYLGENTDSATHLYCITAWVISMWCFGRNYQFKRKAYLQAKTKTTNGQASN